MDKNNIDLNTKSTEEARKAKRATAERERRVRLTASQRAIRNECNVQAQRDRRARLTDSQRATINEFNAQAQRDRRAQFNDSQHTTQNKRNSQAQRERRALLTASQRETINESHTQAQRERRAQLNDSERAIRNESNAQAQRDRRAQFDDSRHTTQNTCNAQAQRDRRALLTASQRAIRNESYTQAQRERRARLTASQLAIRNECNVQAQRDRRARLTASQRAIRQQKHSYLEIQRDSQFNEDQQSRKNTQLRQSYRNSIYQVNNVNMEEINVINNLLAEQFVTEEDHQIVDNQANINNNEQVQVELQTREQIETLRANIKAKKPTYQLALSENTADNISAHDCGEMNIVCIGCNALHFIGEKTKNQRDKPFTKCCRQAKIILPLNDNFPFINLLNGFDSRSSGFLDNARRYNNAFAFASFGHQAANFTSQGPPAFVIHGQVYHAVSPSNPQPGNIPRYSQLYMLDTNEANDHRSLQFQNLNRSLLDEMSTYFNQNNPYALAYRHMFEVQKDEINKAVSEGRQPIEVQMTINRSNMRTGNLPTCNEVAAVFQTYDGAPPSNRDIKIHYRSGRMEQIRFSDLCCDPMTYPVLFPQGQSGWHVNTKSLNLSYSKRITICQYYQYMLQVRMINRVKQINPLLMAAKLSQQYIVDAYCKIEGERLNYIRTHQCQLRVHNYLGLIDFINNRSNEDNIRAGRMIVLPSTFPGSPRAMKQNFLDAMSIVQKFGKPDLFITFTCNPTWPEITRELQGATAANRPDLVAKVFELKLKELLDDIIGKQYFGRVIAHVYTIEFQKRGLPHAHMLFILHEQDKLRDSADIDKVVCAELPDSETEPNLYKIITSRMMHGPCGPGNPSSTCMVKNKYGRMECSKKFPKSFSPETNPSSDGYPIYKRRDDGIFFVKNGFSMDNRWIVPYNKTLCLKYNAHINVEICSSVKSIKYIYKYIYKGHDTSNIVIRHHVQNSDTMEWDEINGFVESRYVGPSEAIWRIMEYKMHGKSHSILRLAVHLENCEPVVFRDGQERAILNQERNNTTLIKWFSLNNECLMFIETHGYLENQLQLTPEENIILVDLQFARLSLNLKYIQVPLYYTWKNKNWHKREQGAETVIPRLNGVNNKDLELYSLRLLLLHVTGSTGFENLKTINGEIFEKFEDAARELGILEDESECNNAMNDAKIYNMPPQLRELFVTLCIGVMTSNAKILFDAHVDAMVEDYIHRNNQLSHEGAINILLVELNRQFGQFTRADGRQKSCKDFGLPEPNNNFPANEEEIIMFNPIEEQLLAQQYLPTLNEDQLFAHNSIMKAIDDPNYEKRQFFIDGPGGSGKTYLYNILMHSVRGRGDSVLAVAQTGLAATLLSGGRTVHSQFGVPLNCTSDKVSGISAESKAANDIKRAKMIIWDEISITDKCILGLVDTMLRDFMGDSRPFGGKVVVVGGDFRQQLPIVPRGTRAQIVEACVKRSELWFHFQHISLTRNMRTSQDQSEFADWLLKLGNGTLPVFPNLGESTIKVPECFISSRSIIDEVFGQIINHPDSPEITQSTILSPKNDDCLRLNEIVLSRVISRESRTYLSIDTVSCDDQEQDIVFPIEYLNTITPSGMPPHKLNLKINCCLMLLRNLNPENGLCNGTRLIVRGMSRNILDCEILTGNEKFIGTRTFIPRITLSPPDSEVHFNLKRRQFPVRLAYCMTITKSQGQTLKKVGLYLRQPVFSHGQLYVSFSRVTHPDNIKVQIEETSEQGHLIRNTKDVYTPNCVFPEIF